MRLFVLLPLLLIATSCSTKKTETPESNNFTSISVEEFKKIQGDRSDEIILDVRTPEEVQHGVIKNAIVMDFNSSDFYKQLTTLDKTKPILVYCAVGGRSGRAMEWMKENNFKEVYNLSGGIEAWLQAGETVE